MSIRVAVIGTGSWGTTVAHFSTHTATTEMWGRDEDVVAAINERHENPRYLAGYDLHPELTASSDLEAVVSAADVLVMGVPSHVFRETLRIAAPHVRPWVPVVSLTKGLEKGTAKRMTEVAAEELPGHPAGVLTGPNLAKEILSGHAAAAVIAFTDVKVATRLQDVFSSPGLHQHRRDRL